MKLKYIKEESEGGREWTRVTNGSGWVLENR
jgi:hypothetical protein